MVENSRLAQILEAENGGDWPKAVALRLSYHEYAPEDTENVRRLVWSAEQSGQLLNVIPIAKKLDVHEYRDLMFSLPLIRYAVRNGEMDWAEEILPVIKEHHTGNEWPIVAEAEMLHKKGLSQEALSLLSDAMPSLYDTYAFLNVSDLYYKLLSEPYAANINVEIIDRSQKPAMPDALLVSLVKDEDDVIFANLKHHYLAGFRNFIIVNNASNDLSSEEIKRFRSNHYDALVFEIFDPVVGYVQDSKTTAAMRFAATVLEGMGRPIRWVFPVDADEFICTTPGCVDLRTALEMADQTDKRVFALVQVNASTPAVFDALPVGSDVLSIFSRRMAYPTLPVFKVGAVYNNALGFDVGNHRPNRDYCDLSKTASSAQFGTYLLHLPLRSVKHVTTKLKNGIAALDAAPHRVGIGGHWRRWHEQYSLKGPVFFNELIENYVRDISEHDDRRRSKLTTE